jgi:hypothetical protein
MRPLGFSSLTKGLLIAALHVGIVASIGAKLLYDRHTRPRVWAQTVPYDPNLPIRGRYLSLQLVVETEGFPKPQLRRELFQWGWGPGERRARLEVRNGKLVAVKDDDGDYYIWWTAAPEVTMPPVPANDCYRQAPDKVAPCLAELEKAPVDFPVVAVLGTPVLYFIPEHAKDPSTGRASGEELWAEVTVPKAGPPRPIQLALKKNGAWQPLELP